MIQYSNEQGGVYKSSAVIMTIHPTKSYMGLKTEWVDLTVFVDEVFDGGLIGLKM